MVEKVNGMNIEFADAASNEPAVWAGRLSTNVISLLS
jgi:hypothetical protein